LTHNPTENTLRDAFARGAALFAPFNFPGCDLIIPVFNLSTKRYTFIVIQVKNRRNDSVTPKLKLNAANDLVVAAQHLKFTSSAPPAHIAIMMCLHSGAPPQKAVIVRPELKSITHNMRKRKASPSGEPNYQWEKTPRVLLLGAGLDEALYPALGKCSGQRDVHMARVVEFLKQLLDCIPQVSVPSGSHDRYQHHLMPIR
jgi:hypothetical protein